MQRSKLNFGASFEEIISIIPTGLSHSFGSNYGMSNNESRDNSSYNLKNEETKCDETKNETKTIHNLAAEQAFLSAIYNTIAIASFFLIVAIFGLLLSKIFQRDLNSSLKAI